MHPLGSDCFKPTLAPAGEKTQISPGADIHNLCHFRFDEHSNLAILWPDPYLFLLFNYSTKRKKKLTINQIQSELDRDSEPSNEEKS